MAKDKCSSNYEKYATVQDYYETVSRRNQAIISILIGIFSNKGVMETYPLDEQIVTVLDQIDDNLSLMDSLVDDIVKELSQKPVKEPVKLRAVAA